MIMMMAVILAAPGQQTLPVETLLLGADREMDPSPVLPVRACTHSLNPRATLNVL